MAERDKFAELRAGGRLWAVSSIHGDAERLRGLHAALAARLAADDRLVYLGNFVGHGSAASETIDELLRFRLWFLARRRAMVCDLAYLRGAQEEMWHKLLQLQFATDPRGVLAWMLEHGVGATLSAYGSNADQGKMAARDGPLAIAACGSKDDPCDQFGACTVRDPLGRVRNRILTVLQTTTLAEMGESAAAVPVTVSRGGPGGVVPVSAR